MPACNFYRTISQFSSIIFLTCMSAQKKMEISIINARKYILSLREKKRNMTHKLAIFSEYVPKFFKLTA